MLNCRRCGGETTVISDQSLIGKPKATDRTVKRRRECQECKSQAGSTETWDEDGTAEHYRARYERAAEWIGQLAFLLKTPAATSKLAEAWIRKDLDRHAAGVGPGRTGGRGEIVYKGPKKSRKGRST